MEARRLVRVPRRIWLTLALVVLAMLLVAQNSTVLSPEMGTYTVLNPRTIAVDVYVAPCSWTRVTNVAESPAEIRVKAETLPCPIPGPRTAGLTVRVLSVSLAADLGSRTVEDANGQAVPLR